MKYKLQKFGKKKANKICEAHAEYQTDFPAIYPVVFEKNEDGRWTVTCMLLPGCISEGNTKEEATENIKDAIRLYLRAIKKEMQIIKQQGAEVLKVAVGV